MSTLAIAPIEEAVKFHSAKTPVGSALRSADWLGVARQLRNASQFSAGVESVRVVNYIQTSLGDLLSHALDDRGALMDRSKFVSELGSLARSAGLKPALPEEQGGLRDITSEARANLIYQQQVGQAYGFADWKTGQDADSLDAFPAQRLVRIRDSKVKRDWESRWKEAGDKVSWEGASRSEWVALKTSPIWAALSVFGNPWPPFDFNSGMWVEDVAREEAVALGLLTTTEQITPDQAQLTDNLAASVSGLDRHETDFLEMAFGDQVVIRNGEAKWRDAGVPYQNWEERGMQSAAEWQDLPDAPDRIPLADAVARMKAGVEVSDPYGDPVRFTPGTLDHWKGYADESYRPTFLPWAEAAVKSPDELWRQKRQDVYVKAFAKPENKYRGVMVAVTHNGEARTWFVRDMKELDAVRQGISVLNRRRS